MTPITVTKPKLMTFEEYRFYESNDDLLYELFRGKLIPMPTPTVLHTQICEYVAYQINAYFASKNLSLIATSNTGVRTEIDSSRISDVIVSDVELMKKITDRPGGGILDFEENPRLVIEVTSQNWREDYLMKRAEYALIEIPEYWIINPNKNIVLVLSNPLEEFGYKHQEFKEGEEFHSVQFTDLKFSVNTLIKPPMVKDLIREKQLEKQQVEDKLNQVQQELELEKQKSDRVLAKLKELGIDLDTI